MDKHWYVYILASKKLWVIYTWVTSNLEKRITQHKYWFFDWFTKILCSQISLVSKIFNNFRSNWVWKNDQMMEKTKKNKINWRF